MSDNGFGKLERLSDAETLVIKRRRRGENQTDAAQRYNTNYTAYSKWERGLNECPKREIIRKLENHELCFLYRRRKNVTQASVADELNVCRYWLNQMERGEKPCSALLQYWG